MTATEFNPGLGIGAPYTPAIRTAGGAIKIPVKLTKSHPDYEGPHEPFWINSRDLVKHTNIEINHYFTGANDKTHF